MWKRKNQEKKNEVQINGKTVAVEKLSFREVIDLTFLILPYLKLIKRIQAEYNSDTKADIFRFTVEALLDGMSEEDIYGIFSVALRVHSDDVRAMSVPELVAIVPKIIRENNLIDLYLLLKRLGAVDGG